jgi:hypothetical protein
MDEGTTEQLSEIVGRSVQMASREPGREGALRDEPRIP